MSAALTGIYSVGSDLFVAHVGHSRCYLFRNGSLVQLTRDHTLGERRAISPHPIPIRRAIEDVTHLLTHAYSCRDCDLDAAGIRTDQERRIMTTTGLPQPRS
jgi:serine/threonine protein phosphatase PrpC